MPSVSRTTNKSVLLLIGHLDSIVVITMKHQDNECCSVITEAGLFSGPHIHQKSNPCGLNWCFFNVYQIIDFERPAP